MTGPPYDARAVANLLLDLAEGRRLLVTPMALQKLLYFTHAYFRIAYGAPLVTGQFEAWEHGPVHPGVYQQFKAAGARPVTFRAMARDYATCTDAPIPLPDDERVYAQLDRVLSTLGRLSPNRLRELSHAAGGPWHHVVNEARTGRGLGLRIFDSVTVERFKHLKVSIRPAADAGDHLEDAPLAGDGPLSDRSSPA